MVPNKWESDILTCISWCTAYFVDGPDIGKFTMMTVDDIRTLNKNVHFRPPSNLYDINGLASLWEKKIGRTLPRVTVTENDLLTAAAGLIFLYLSCTVCVFFYQFGWRFYLVGFVIHAENRIPESIVASFTHDIFIKGCQTNFPIEGPNDIDVATLYPEESFRTLDECFNDFLVKVGGKLHTDKIATMNTAAAVEVEPRAITATCAWTTFCVS